MTSHKPTGGDACRRHFVDTYWTTPTNENHLHLLCVCTALIDEGYQGMSDRVAVEFADVNDKVLVQTVAFT